MSVPYPTTPEDIKHAEAALLGSLLLYPEQGTIVHTLLKPEDFSEDHHRLIYEALQAIPGSSALDSIHAVRILLSDHELEQIGGEAYLMMLKQQAESMTMSIEDQVSLLKQALLHRLLMQIGEGLHTRTMNYDNDDLRQLIGMLEQMMFVTKQLLSSMQTPLPHVNPLQTDLETYLADLDTRRTQLGEASASLREAKLWIDDTANLSTAQLRDKAHLLVEHCGVDLLIVDYVHLMLSR